MTSSDPEIKFSVDVAEVIESIKNAGFATTNADVVLLGAALGYKYGWRAYSPETQGYVRFGVLSRQLNFEELAVALMLASRVRNVENIDEESIALDKNLNYLSKMTNSGLMHLKSVMRDMNREASDVLTLLIHQALETRQGNVLEDLNKIGDGIVFTERNEG